MDLWVLHKSTFNSVRSGLGIVFELLISLIWLYVYGQLRSPESELDCFKMDY